MINVELFIVGELYENCYLVTDERAGLSLVVDPGEENLKLFKRIDEFGAEKLKYILLTHGHFDHIGGVAKLALKYGAKIVISEADASFTTDNSLNLSLQMGVSLKNFSPDILVRDGDRLSFGESGISVMLTPGHTHGSCCYIIKNHIFTGDTLMSGSIGRVDFPTGSANEMKLSIKKISNLDGDYELHAGHGRQSTLERERKMNMYMREDFYDNL